MEKSKNKFKVDKKSAEIVNESINDAIESIDLIDPVVVEDEPKIKKEIKSASQLDIRELKQYIAILAKEQYDCLNLLIKKLHEAGKPTQRYIKLKNQLHRDLTKTLCKE